jgi:hypothetical protein
MKMSFYIVAASAIIWSKISEEGENRDNRGAISASLFIMHFARCTCSSSLRVGITRPRTPFAFSRVAAGSAAAQSHQSKSIARRHRHVSRKPNPSKTGASMAKNQPSL